ncbi:uncharacterized protein EI97DRAFT_256282 [Westerdykella ornata]|uniref:Uncharacterized protein n=1 Tax=Westerdykella ornata TaxID=318751 RepID=A0A6A6JRJ0_WESOR|nr:uncharacterized protein EI97DRAFT_256282 [Westerdykella ornata]KAF2278488.1 hypothetical protein EI97DRAFT_256282 [Westerdykella ornata]
MDMNRFFSWAPETVLLVFKKNADAKQSRDSYMGDVDIVPQRDKGTVQKHASFSVVSLLLKPAPPTPPDTHTPSHLRHGTSIQGVGAGGSLSIQTMFSPAPATLKTQPAWNVTHPVSQNPPTQETSLLGPMCGSQVVADHCVRFSSVGRSC